MVQPQTAEGVRNQPLPSATKDGIMVVGDSQPREKYGPTEQWIIDKWLRKEAILAVAAERDRQTEKWGTQSHPDHTGRQNDAIVAALAKADCDDREKDGTQGWREILWEEVWEAFAEVDPARLREELVQVAAVAVAWVEDIDRRKFRHAVPDGNNSGGS